MNMAYYVLIFDEAWETMLNKFEMGGAKAQINKRSTMVVETRTTYENEVKENEEVDIYCTFFDHDKKRLHLKCEMIEKKTGKNESQVIKIMRRNLKPSSFRLWRKRVHNTSIKHRKKFKLERKKMREKIRISDIY